MAIGLLVLRVVLGAFVAGHGVQKLTHFWGGGGLDASSEEFRNDGFLGGRLTALMAGGAQLGGGVLLILGLLTPLASVAVIAPMVIATIVKLRVGFWSQDGGYEYPLFLAVLGAAIGFTGPGAVSLDAAIGLAPLYSVWWVGIVVVVLGVGGALLARAALYRRELDPKLKEARA